MFHTFIWKLKNKISNIQGNRTSEIRTTHVRPVGKHTKWAISLISYTSLKYKTCSGSNRNGKMLWRAVILAASNWTSFISWLFSNNKTVEWFLDGKSNLSTCFLFTSPLWKAMSPIRLNHHLLEKMYSSISIYLLLYSKNTREQLGWIRTLLLHISIHNQRQDDTSHSPLVLSHHGPTTTGITSPKEKYL